MESYGVDAVSASALRVQVNDLANRLAGQLAATADAIRDESEDPAVRRFALALKADGTPAIYAAAFRGDPLAATVDLWALAFQLSHFLEDGGGQDLFGPQQPLATEGARALVAEVEVLVGPLLETGELPVVRGRVEGWARQHPLERTLSARASVEPFLEDLREEQGALAAVGAAANTMESLSEKLGVYAGQLPRQARWQAQLLLADLAQEEEVQRFLGDLDDAGTAARSADRLLRELDPATTQAMMRELMATERAALVAAVDEQRRSSLEFVRSERLASLALLREERLAVLAAIRRERLETLRQLDPLRGRAVDDTVEGLRELVDYTLWRVAALLLLLMVVAAVMGAAGYRALAGRGPGAMSRP